MYSVSKKIFVSFGDQATAGNLLTFRNFMNDAETNASQVGTDLVPDDHEQICRRQLHRTGKSWISRRSNCRSDRDADRLEESVYRV